MKKQNIIKSLCLSFLTISCTASVFTDIQRERKEPKTVSPTLELLKEIETITVQWPKDSYADEYALEMALVPDIPGQTINYSTLYTGRESQYVLKGVPDNHWRLFRLRLRRGNKWFGPSRPVVGFGSDSVKDEYEPNNHVDNAVDVVQGNLTANLFTYLNSINSIQKQINDNDWYQIELFGGYQANITITQDGLVAGADSAIDLQIEGKQKVRVKSSTEIIIPNVANETKKIRFRLTVNPANLGITGTQRKYIKFISYTLSIAKIVP